MPAFTTLASAFNRLMAPRWELACDVFFELSLFDPLPVAKCPFDLDIRLASEADLDVICRAYAPDPYLFLGDLDADGSLPDWVRELYADRLRRGELCFIAAVDGEIAHINWTCLTRGDTLPGHTIELGPDEVYTTDAITPAKFRGKNVHAVVLKAMLVHARQLGRRTAYTLGRSDRKGLTGLRRLGWREIGRVYYLLYGNGYRAAVLRKIGRLERLRL